MLTNPIYCGLIRHKEKTWPGLHHAIVDQDLWDRVQARLQDASARRRGQRVSPQIAASSSSALLGKVRDETGDLLTPSHTQRHGRRFRYYVSNRLISGRRDPEAWRLPAPELERAISTVITSHLADHANRHAVLTHADAAASVSVSQRTQALAEKIRPGAISAAVPLLDTIAIAQGHLTIHFNPVALGSALMVSHEDLASSLLILKAPFTCRRRGVETKIVAGERKPEPDPTLLRTLRTAHLWAAKLRGGKSLKAIAADGRVSERYVARVIPIARLSPRIQQAIVTGTHPVTLTLAVLMRTKLPLDWTAQERQLGDQV